jgi:hypothetical protein
MTDPRSEARAPSRLWPTECQQRAQAMFDADKGLFVADYPEFHPTDADGEPIPFCGECGRVRPCNPENDLCSGCEAALKTSPGDGGLS